MRTLTSRWKRALGVLAVGSGWVAAGSCRHGSRQGGLEVWSIQSGEVVFSYPRGERVYSTAIDPAGRLFLSHSEGLRIVDLVSGSEPPAPGPGLYHPEFSLSRDGQRLLVSSAFNQYGALSAWERGADGLFGSLWQEGPHAFLWFEAPVLSPDGRLAAVVERSPGEGMIGASIVLVVRQTSDGDVILEMAMEKSHELMGIGLSDGGLLLGLRKREIRGWDARTGELVRTIGNPVRKRFTAMAVHPEGRWMATTDAGGTARFWDTESFQQVAALDWRIGPLGSLAFASDGAVAAAGSDDGRVVVWDVDL